MTHIVRIGYRYYTHSFIHGLKPISPSCRKHVTEDDILAHALWLERNGKGEDAEEVLDAYVVSLREVRSAM